MAYLQRYLHQVPPEEQDLGAITFYASLDSVARVAPSVTAQILAELRSQTSHVKLIASENYSSLAVQQAMGNLLTDKYAEGVSGKRFYAGCDAVDTIEAEAALELKLLFGADHAYLQPHSGADANLIAYWAIVMQRVQSKRLEGLGKKSVDELGDEEYEAIRQEMTNQKVMGLDLGSGGHLTHGYRHNVSGKMFRSCSYGVDPESGLLDYDAIAEQARAEKPDILLAGYSAYPRLIDFARMREIADEVGAVLMADMAHFAGLVAGKVLTGNENPVPFSDVITSTTHKTLRGPRGGIILCKETYREAIDKGCPLVIGGPLPHVMAAKLVAFKEAGAPSFQEYARNVVANAKALAEELIAQGVTVLTGGTDNHLVLLDVRPFGLTGRQAENALRAADLTVNRNALPRDPNGPWYTSGIRIGTPAITTLGMGADEMRQLARMIAEVLKHSTPVKKARAETDPAVLERCKSQVQELLSHFPLYPKLCLDRNFSESQTANR
jgi:glycine hydroxymethyltransferase